MPRFSVIIPNYNHGRFLERRIESVLQQSFTDFELILLDDHSTDNSINIINKYRDHPSVSLVTIYSNNSGSPFRQWQKGIQSATANWIWIAESDDFADKDFLQTADTAINDPSVSLFYSDARMVDASGNTLTPGTFSAIKNNFFDTTKWSKDYNQPGISELNEYLQLICAINNAGSAVMKKEILSGFLNELAGFQYHGDWFCYIQLALKGNIAYSPHPLNTVRIHEQSHINSKKSQIKSKQEHYRILLFLLKQKEIKHKGRITRFFCEQYMNLSLRDNGLADSFSIILAYFGRDFFTTWRVLYHILLIKLTRRKVKPVF